jgi:hypothetical protein
MFDTESNVRLLLLSSFNNCYIHVKAKVEVNTRTVMSGGELRRRPASQVMCFGADLKKATAAHPGALVYYQVPRQGCCFV